MWRLSPVIGALFVGLWLNVTAGHSDDDETPPKSSMLIVDESDLRVDNDRKWDHDDHRRTMTKTTATTTTTPPLPNNYGGSITKDAFAGWLSVWRSKYQAGLWNAGLSDPWESLLPNDLKLLQPMVVESTGGVAGGVVTEGMGYGIMIEGFLAAKGDDIRAKNHSLRLIKSWLGMVNGGDTEDTIVQPFGGGDNETDSATHVDVWPYGISVVEWSHEKLAPAGIPAWKFPITEENLEENMGSATDGDQDAIIGMIYTAKALDYPADFVDMVMRTVISFASADLGFPDLYRVLPGGEKIFVPKLGSMWGGLLPEHGKFKTQQQPWCYSPGYFAPAHYRSMRDFVLKTWKPEFNDYLPRYLDGRYTSMQEMVDAFDSAVTAGYNILYYSSCSSGSVSNWVGVMAPCENDNDLHCAGVPWKHTPWVGPHGGQCQESGTKFGSFGADASRSAWRIAMDYVLYRDESSNVVIYDRDGHPLRDVSFGARPFLNRIVEQYAKNSRCDGGIAGACYVKNTSPERLAYAYDVSKKFNAQNVTCSNVPNPPMSWWAGFMAYPTFTAFVAPYEGITPSKMSTWMDTFSSICNFKDVDKWNFTRGHNPRGSICVTSYFEASQAVIATMVMADTLVPIFESRPYDVVIFKDEVTEKGVKAYDGAVLNTLSAGIVFFATSLVLIALGGVAVKSRCRRCRSIVAASTNGWKFTSRQVTIPSTREDVDAEETMMLRDPLACEDA